MAGCMVSRGVVQLRGVTPLPLSRWTLVHASRLVGGMYTCVCVRVWEEGRGVRSSQRLVRVSP